MPSFRPVTPFLFLEKGPFLTVFETERLWPYKYISNHIMGAVLDFHSFDTPPDPVASNMKEYIAKMHTHRLRAIYK